MAALPRYRSVFAPDVLAGQVIIVTGGGTGLGRTMAHEIASLGATVVIAARRPEPLERTKNEIEALGGKCDVLPGLNVRDEKACAAAVAAVVAKHGRLDGLVNNAGGQFAAPAEKITAKGLSTVLELNVVGTFNMTRAAYLGYMKQHGGSIVNILAMHENGYVNLAHTAAARAAVWNLTKTLVLEWSTHSGVRINCVVPGPILAGGAVSGHYPKELVDAYDGALPMIPSGRFGTDSEVSAAVVYLLSPAAAYTNGAEIRVDGGVSLRQPLIGGEAAFFSKESKTRMFSGWGDADASIAVGKLGEPFAGWLRKWMAIGEPSAPKL
ncbi:putative citronellol/citronellal dehydrogenase AtuB [Hyaloraphidium curvatum]|nr:putative citronellol/citronellal dehydrogenase AtuB [Hyaloraphidium curvatum]